jgi:hypothetical protein
MGAIDNKELVGTGVRTAEFKSYLQWDHRLGVISGLWNICESLGG